MPSKKIKDRAVSSSKLTSRRVAKRGRVVWLSWKDHTHPTAGGAELIKSHLAKQMVNDGFQLTVITARYKGSSAKSQFDGYDIVRVGNRFTVYFHAWRYYRKYLRYQTDLVIDECNTVPFFAKFYADVPVIMLFHQLARIIWFYEMPFPISAMGYVFEPLYLWLLSNQMVITVSESTKADLQKYGFSSEKIHIIPEILMTEPVKDLARIQKSGKPTLLIHGTVRNMKRTLDGVRAYEQAKETIPDLQLHISGNLQGTYGQKVVKYIAKSQFKNDIKLYGLVTHEQKIKIMQEAHFIVVTSAKEGWGLIVSEAASQGTPAIVYDVDGLRDAVVGGECGLLCEPNVASLKVLIEQAFSEGFQYEAMRTKAHQFTKTLTVEKSYASFMSYLQLTR